jgi:hypothetical protein
MSTTAPTTETDPTRRAIVAAMDRLLAGTPQRSTGRLNVTQLATEAGLKRWHLTHQHPDLRELFQQIAAALEAKSRAHARSTDEFEQLKVRHAELQAHCRQLEVQLQAYATALSLLSLEHAALSGRDADAAKIHVIPRRRGQQP